MGAKAKNWTIIVNPGKGIRSMQRNSSNTLKDLKSRLSARNSEFFKPTPKIKTEELQLFAQQLSTLLEAGVPLLLALDMLSEQTEHKKLSGVLGRLREDINGGTSFTKALSRFPRMFPGSFVAMIRAGEAGGQLAGVLKLMASHLKIQDEQSKKINSAIVYPRFVSIFFLLLLGGVLFGLVPQFEETFASYGSELPRPTQLLLAMSRFLMQNIVAELIVLAMIVVTFKKFKESQKGKYFLDNLYLKLPVIGDLIAKASISRFCRTLKVSIGSGVQLLDGLEIAGRTIDNQVFVKAISEAQQGVLEGNSLSSQLARNPVFPSLIVKMVATGEESGSLEKMLNNLADLFDTHVDTRIASISSIIEPVLMIGLGIVAVIVIMALYLPIFKLGDVNF